MLDRHRASGETENVRGPGSFLIAVIVLLLAMTGAGRGLMIWKPYAEHVAESDAIVVGTVLRTEAPDLYSPARVSRMALSAVLSGDVAADTIRVYWNKSTSLTHDGGGVWMEGTGPDLDDAIGEPTLWLLHCCHDSLLVADFESRPLGPEHSADIYASLHELSSYEGWASGSAKVTAVTIYLEGYLAGLAAGWQKSADEWRSN
jgi:hypothetical protein